jgi:hypothetical protein
MSCKNFFHHRLRAQERQKYTVLITKPAQICLSLSLSVYLFTFGSGSLMIALEVGDYGRHLSSVLWVIQIAVCDKKTKYATWIMWGNFLSPLFGSLELWEFFPPRCYTMLLLLCFSYPFSGIYEYALVRLSPSLSNILLLLIFIASLKWADFLIRISTHKPEACHRRMDIVGTKILW